MRILIAEDDTTTQQFYRSILSQCGYEFDLVPNGHEAVELIDKQGELYDLCFMDIEMPVMGGLEAIRLLRERITSLPIIAFSSAPEYEAESIAAGADAFYCKPVLEGHLCSLIAKPGKKSKEPM